VITINRVARSRPARGKSPWRRARNRARWRNLDAPLGIFRARAIDRIAIAYRDGPTIVFSLGRSAIFVAIPTLLDREESARNRLSFVILDSSVLSIMFADRVRVPFAEKIFCFFGDTTCYASLRIIFSALSCNQS
jgi:hypothetical protein